MALEGNILYRQIFYDFLQFTIMYPRIDPSGQYKCPDRYLLSKLFPDFSDKRCICVLQKQPAKVCQLIFHVGKPDRIRMKHPGKKMLCKRPFSSQCAFYRFRSFVPLVHAFPSAKCCLNLCYTGEIRHDRFFSLLRIGKLHIIFIDITAYYKFHFVPSLSI